MLTDDVDDVREAHHMLLGIVMGNPQVPRTQPVPVPVEICTRVNGYGFWRVQVTGCARYTQKYQVGNNVYIF